MLGYLNANIFIKHEWQIMLSMEFAVCVTVTQT